MISAPTAPPEPALLGPPPTPRGRNRAAAPFPRITPAAEPASRQPAQAEQIATQAPKPDAEAAPALPSQRKSGRKPTEDPADPIATVPAPQPAAAAGKAGIPSASLPDLQRASLPAPEPGSIAAMAQALGDPASRPAIGDPVPDATLASGTPAKRTPPGARSLPANAPPGTVRPATALSPTLAQPGAPADDPAKLAAAQPGHQNQVSTVQPAYPGSHARGIQAPGPQPASGAAQPQGDSESPDSQGSGSRGQAVIARTPAGFSGPAAQSLPFRLDAGTPIPDGAVSQPGANVEPAAASASLPASEQSVIQQGADVIVGLDSNHRLDVTIATTTRQAADRVEAERADLQRDLTALGAEVEAIRVEVRSERAPDGSGQNAQSAAPGGQGDRQGQAMRNRNEQPGEWPSPAVGPPGQPTIRIRLNADAGRVDRYA